MRLRGLSHQVIEIICQIKRLALARCALSPPATHRACQARLQIIWRLLKTARRCRHARETALIASGDVTAQATKADLRGCRVAHWARSSVTAFAQGPACFVERQGGREGDLITTRIHRGTTALRMWHLSLDRASLLYARQATAHQALSLIKL